jgi:hypothetical protein
MIIPVANVVLKMPDKVKNDRLGILPPLNNAIAVLQLDA